MSKIKVNTIAPRSGTTVTLGEAGDTIALGACASQTGFGRTGTVDWCTTVKTSPLTAVSGKGYFINTTGGAITVTLPSSPSAGDIVSLKDYLDTWATACKAVTLGRGGSKIGGNCVDATLNTAGQSITMIYVDGTQGWENIQTDTTVAGSLYVTATGGTITTSGDYKIHTFTTDGTFCVSAVGPGTPTQSDEVSYLVVAGGGGGSSATPCDGGQGAGGAGGFREGKNSSDPYTDSPLDSGTAITVTATAYPITVGGGGAASPHTGCRQGCSGGVSTFSTITSTGGGGGGSPGGSAKPAPFMTDLEGGSGGGIGYGGYGSPTGTLFGAGNEPPTSPPQGNDGGGSVYPVPGGGPAYGGGGGGGATTAGTDAASGAGGVGGTGATTCISGSPTVYAGGGGAGVTTGFPGSGGAGGPGGGGAGAKNPVAGVNGTPNTGGGGGGGGTPALAGGLGGSGVVILRYKYQ